MGFGVWGSVRVGLGFGSLDSFSNFVTANHAVTRGLLTPDQISLRAQFPYSQPALKQNNRILASTPKLARWLRSRRV